MKRERNISFYSIIKWIFVAVMAIIATVLVVFEKQDYFCKRGYPLHPLVYFFGGTAIVCLFYLFAFLKRNGFANQKRARAFVLAGSAAFFLLLLFSTYHYYFETGWDVSAVFGLARNIARYGTKPEVYSDFLRDYFSIFPNNVISGLIYSLPIKFFSLLGVTNDYYSCIVFSCFLVALSALFIFFAAEMFTNDSYALCTWLLFVFFAGISPWVTVPYSDVLGLFFVSLQIFLLACVLKRNNKFVFCMLLAFSAYIALKVKPQAFILFIAFCAVGMLKFLFSPKEEKRKMLVSICAVISGLVMSVVCVHVANSILAIPVDKERSLANVLYYLYMGLNYARGGEVNVEDYEKALSFSTVLQRNEFLKSGISQRISDMGILKLLDLFRLKMQTNFSDGTFAWWIEGTFYSIPYDSGIKSIRDFYESLYYLGASRYHLFSGYSQFVWYGIMGCALVSSVHAKPEMEKSIIWLSIIGLVLFELLFEARARYVFCCLPLFIMAVLLGIYGIGARKKEIENEKAD